MKKLVLSIVCIIYSSCSHQINRDGALLIAPIFKTSYTCSEHYAGQFSELGDSLGTDCFVEKFVKNGNRQWLKRYKSNGKSNSDWYGWRDKVYSPVSGKIIRIKKDSKVNVPGIKGKGVANLIIIKTNNSEFILLAHVREIKVKAGDFVSEGDFIARLGNNAQSWTPHIHLGAWKGKKPLQLRFDQSKINKY